MAAYASRMREEGRFGQTEEMLTRVGLGEYLAQVFGGIPMNQGEIVRPADFGLGPDEIAPFRTEVVEGLIASGNTRENRAALAALIGEAREGAIGDPGLDETFEAIRGEMRRFADAEVAPHAQGWHRANAYIPLEVIAGLSGMGVFGLTIPEAYGGMGLGKVAMCVVSEELSRGYIGVGSLGTRSEIAAELILVGGTEAQKQKYLPDRRLHRAQHRLRPREPAHPRGARRRRIPGQRRQDLDHPSRPRRPDDAARAHQSQRERLSGPLDVPGREAARDRR
jgi:(2S)-methylsuccinyl-CoA dehydrogenase